ncbi:MAG: Hsp20/alpha crystallin family protein, partial [Deltaproteobacteria bacterium]|nr:Hsp20/alpha crystallin family protein [Deltaproteobacteria bacterium]
SKDAIDLKIQGNYLEISGTRKISAPEGYRVHRSERGSASFTRSLTLPADVDSGKVTATLKDGILVLTLPKSEAAKPRQISIN